MSGWLIDNEPAFRAGAFGVLLVLMGLWELGRPILGLREGRGLRWLTNFGLLLLGAGVARLAAPIGAMAAALHASQHEIGILYLVEIPTALHVVLAMVALDFIIYVQHWIFHKAPVLWRLHQVHHADRDYDVSTALRFHPIEILLSLVIKVASIYALGAPAIAVILFEVILNGAAMFNHGNVSLGSRIDAAMRLFIVTPDMHRVHHSIRRNETNSNYGFNLPWWDRLFGTYMRCSQDGKTGLTIGLPGYQDRRLGLWALLLLPLRQRIDTNR